MTHRALITAAILAVTAAPAAAGTISGQITAQVGGAPIAGADVRVWVEGVKGWSILSTTTADGSGNYSFTLAANDYLIDARGNPSAGINYGDRWYDVAAPNSGGYIGEDADELAVPAVGGVTANVALEILGGSDGVVLRTGAIVAPGMLVRMERAGEPRIHHNDQSKNPTGSSSMRGMVPATDYQFMVYDPAGVRATLLVGGPYTITAGANASFGNLTMADYGVDPHESNNSANCGAVSIDGAALHMDPPQPWSSSTNARIGPLASNDVDWFCYTAVEGDRLYVEATTQFTFSAATRYSPWTDPLLAFWRGAQVTKLVEDDDGGTGPLDALVDTGPLTAGCHCTSITTFGDPDYNGTGQTSTGRYQLRVTMGNRPPVLSIKKGATEVPASPATFSIDEGDTMVLDLAYADADHDVPTTSFVHRDNTAAVVTDGTLVLGADTGSYTWTAGPGAAALSPYTLVLQAGDAEFNRTKTVQLVVNAVNMPPELPIPISPIDDAVVTDGATALTWTNADDPDGDTVSYDVELYTGDTTGLPAQSATGLTGGAGTTAWSPTALAENTRAFWRVRGRDPGGGLSPWTEYEGYLVDSANDPPETPILIKPAESELLLVRRPALSVLNVEDPEDDAVEFIFEVARDVDFTVVVWTSIVVPQNELSATTMTTMDQDLEWGLEFYARVMAQDVRGGMSAWSDPHHFRVKENIPPTSPVFDPGCTATTYDEEAPTEVVVTNVEDPENEVVTFELELFDFEDDPATATPLYTTSTEMDGSDITTAIPIDLSDVPNGHYRYRVRAFDGTDGSAWIECELTLALPEMEMGSPDGGCCSTGTRPVGIVLLGLLVVLGLRRRRRR